VVICLERGADLHMTQLMPLPLTVSCSSKIQIGFAFLVPADLGSSGQRAVKRMYVGLGPSTSYSIHFFTQSSSYFRSTCPYQRSLFCCNTNAMSSISSLSLNSLLGSLSFSLTHITHPPDHSRLCSLKCHYIFFPYRPGITSMQHAASYMESSRGYPDTQSSPSHFHSERSETDFSVAYSSQSL